MAFGIGCHGCPAPGFRVPCIVENPGAEPVLGHPAVLPRADDGAGRTADVCGLFPHPVALLSRVGRGGAVRPVVAADEPDATHLPRKQALVVAVARACGMPAICQCRHGLLDLPHQVEGLVLRCHRGYDMCCPAAVGLPPFVRQKVGTPTVDGDDHRHRLSAVGLLRPGGNTVDGPLELASRQPSPTVICRHLVGTAGDGGRTTGLLPHGVMP